MCDPTVLALSAFAIKTAGNIGAAVSQNNNADANKSSAIDSETRSVNDLNVRENQEKQAAGQQIEAAARQTRTALSSARLGAGEAGVSGNSVDSLLQDIGNKDSVYEGDVKLNAQNQQDQMERQKLGIYSDTQSRINQVKPANPWATALTIGGSAIGTLAQLSSRNPPSDGESAPAASSFLSGSSPKIGATSNPQFTMPQLRLPTPP